uniref:hypothetical protein n=1 Tax=Pseudomonas migulae TaxID=78543 RepID=UPI00209D23F5|nr:hypothetical protein [Pseudomonas migulae]
MPRSVHADRGQKGVLQWRNDTPVALDQGCDLWSRWGKITNGVANVTKHDAGQLTIDESYFVLVSTTRNDNGLQSACAAIHQRHLVLFKKEIAATQAVGPGSAGFCRSALLAMSADLARRFSTVVSLTTSVSGRSSLGTTGLILLLALLVVVLLFM